MLIQTIILFIGLAFLLFLLGKYYLEAKEAGPYMAGFVLIILAVLSLTTGISVKSGETCTTYTSDHCEVMVYDYTNLGDLEKVTFAGVSLATGLLLFLTGFNDRKQRLEMLK